MCNWADSWVDTALHSLYKFVQNIDIGRHRYCFVYLFHLNNDDSAFVSHPPVLRTIKPQFMTLPVLSGCIFLVHIKNKRPIYIFRDVIKKQNLE